MNHPTDDQLTDLLYDDDADGTDVGARAAVRAEVGRHVQACDACRRRIAAWHAVRRELCSLPFPAPARQSAAPTRRGWLRSLARQAVAAAVLLVAGYGLARLTVEHVESPRLRAELARQARLEIDQKLDAFASQQAGERRGFERSVAEVLGRFSAQHAAEQAALRRDVETVALVSQEEFTRIERGTAAASAPAAPPNR